MAKPPRNVFHGAVALMDPIVPAPLYTTTHSYLTINEKNQKTRYILRFTQNQKAFTTDVPATHAHVSC